MADASEMLPAYPLPRAMERSAAVPTALLAGSIRAVIEGSTVNGLLGDDLPAWDQGHLHAHQIAAGPTDVIIRHLDRARRSRYGLLAWLSPGRRHYLAGLINGLERALEVRERERALNWGSPDEKTALP